MLNTKSKEGRRLPFSVSASEGLKDDAGQVINARVIAFLCMLAADWNKASVDYAWTISEGHLVCWRNIDWTCLIRTYRSWWTVCCSLNIVLFDVWCNAACHSNAYLGCIGGVHIWLKTAWSILCQKWTCHLWTLCCVPIAWCLTCRSLVRACRRIASRDGMLFKVSCLIVSVFSKLNTAVLKSLILVVK
jgi:hypothetical protein